MTTLTPPPRPQRTTHQCDTPGLTTIPHHPHGTLFECPDCGRWWKLTNNRRNEWAWDWLPVRGYDIPARRRIAAHESNKMHDRVPNIVGDLHWWDCHPNPNRGRP